MKVSISLASHQAIRQNHQNQKLSISLSVLKLAVQTAVHPLWKVHWWVSKSSSQSSSLLQDLGYIVLSLHEVIQENMCCVTLDHDEVQEGACPKGVASPSVLQSSRS